MELLKNETNNSIIDLTQEAFCNLAKVREELKELEGLKKHYEDIIKKAMDSKGLEELASGGHVARWTVVENNRLDTKALKEEQPEVYNMYFKKGVSTRFNFY